VSFCIERHQKKMAEKVQWTVDKFTTDDLALFQEAFQFYAAQVGESADHITLKELPMVLRSVGIPVDFSDEERMKSELSGNIVFPVFLTAAARCYKQRETNQSLTDAFARFDPAGKGSIPTADFKHALTTLGDPFTAEELDGFLKEADSGGNVNYKDYAPKLLASASDSKKL